MNTFLQGLLAAAIGGAFTAGTAVSVDGGDLRQSLAKLGAVAAAGAVTGVLAFLTKSPLGSGSQLPGTMQQPPAAPVNFNLPSILK